MKRIVVTLNRPIVSPLLDVLTSLGLELDKTLAAPLRLKDLEPDFEQSWKEELLVDQDREVQGLLALFDAEFNETGMIHIDEDEAESLLRACSALRLALRTRRLKALSDQVLESGKTDNSTVPPPLRVPLMAYIFLASLQEIILQELLS